MVKPSFVLVACLVVSSLIILLASMTISLTDRKTDFGQPATAPGFVCTVAGVSLVSAVGLLVVAPVVKYMGPAKDTNDGKWYAGTMGVAAVVGTLAAMALAGTTATSTATSTSTSTSTADTTVITAGSTTVTSDVTIENSNPVGNGSETTASGETATSAYTTVVHIVSGISLGAAVLGAAIVPYYLDGKPESWWLVAVTFLAILIAALSGFSLHLATETTSVDYNNVARGVSIPALIIAIIAGLVSGVQIFRVVAHQ